MFERFNQQAIATIMMAQNEARMLKQSYVGSELILVGLMAQGETVASTVLKSYDITLRSVQTEVKAILGEGIRTSPTEIPFTPKTKQLFQQAIQEARQLDHKAVGPEHLLLAIVHDPKNVASQILQTLGADLDKIRKALLDEMGEVATVGATRSPAKLKRPPQRGKKEPQFKALEEFATDLTELAAQGKIDPIVGREKEITRVVQILGRRRKNNPVLLGEPGVGKTAIAEGLAQRIVNQDVPESLLDKRVFSLDLSAIVSGSKLRGEFEERLQQLISDVQSAGNIILVIDEVHTLVGAGAMGGGGTDAANMLKPALARGELQCIGATTLDEYRKYVEKDAALERRFQPVIIDEPSVEDTIDILRGVRGRYEQHHQLEITDEALEAAATLGDRYISDRYLPDKAIDLMDEAGSRVRFRNYQNQTKHEFSSDLREAIQAKDSAVLAQDFDAAVEWRDRETELRNQIQAQIEEGAIVVSEPLDGHKQVNGEDIAQVVAAWTGVPVNRLTQSESAMLVHLEDELHERLIGQQDAVTAVAKAIRRARVGLANPNRPMGSFIFCGPTGVGKTELAKALAVSVFGSEEAMVRLDMSEYMERQSTSKLIGSPPGFVGYEEGGQLTEAVRRNPYTLILMDEIEKAHPDVFNLMLQLLDDGQLTDSQGRIVNFKNTLIIMTSNLGATAIEKGGTGFGFEVNDMDADTARYQRIQSQVNDKLKDFFRPEFLNRLDDVIVFRQLSRDEVAEIADLQLRQVENRLKVENEMALQVTDAFKQRLIEEGYDPSYGARPLRRAIARLVEDYLAEAMLAGKIHPQDTVVLDLDDDNQVIVYPQKQEERVEAIAEAR